MPSTTQDPQESSHTAREIPQSYRRAHARKTGTWISTFFLGNSIPVKIPGSSEFQSVWRVDSVIWETWTYYPPADGEIFSYATALFRCVQVTGCEVGHEAMMKIFLQIDGEPCTLPGGLAEEIRAVERIANLKDDFPTARMRHHTYGRQANDLWVQGGFLEVLILDYLPGTSLTKKSFARMPYSEREEIRHALRHAEERLREANVLHIAQDIEFLNWDKKDKKCYVNNLYGVVFHKSLGVSPYYATDWGVSEGSICTNRDRYAKRWKQCCCKECEGKSEHDQDTYSSKVATAEDIQKSEKATSSGTPSLTSDSEGTQADHFIDTPAGSPTSARTAANKGSTEESATTTEPEDKSSRERLQQITDLMQDMQNDTTSLDKVLAYMESIRHDTASSSIDKVASNKS